MAANNDNPFTQWLGKLTVPGLDIQSVMEQGKQDWETLQQANQTATAGWQQLAQRQQEMMQQAIQEWQSSTAAGMSINPLENAEQVKQNAQQFMENMRELSAIATEAQTEAGEIMRKRFEENLARLTNPSGKS